MRNCTDRRRRPLENRQKPPTLHPSSRGPDQAVHAEWEPGTPPSAPIPPGESPQSLHSQRSPADREVPLALRLPPSPSGVETAKSTWRAAPFSGVEEAGAGRPEPRERLAAAVLEPRSQRIFAAAKRGEANTRDFALLEPRLIARLQSNTAKTASQSGSSPALREAPAAAGGGVRPDTAASVLREMPGSD